MIKKILPANQTIQEEMQLIVTKPHNDWAQFPKSDIPILPVIDCHFSTKKYGNHNNTESVFFSKSNIYSHSGRYAFSQALEIIDIDPQCSVLIPSYHCLSMIAPVFWTGADIQFYKLKKDLSIDVVDIENKISPSTRAVVVVHYFGFPQNLSRVMEICKKYNISLIEDCAHAFFGTMGAKKIGGSGDFAIASLKKFFPVADGGVLAVKGNMDKKPYQTSLKIVTQLKYMINLLEESVLNKRLESIKIIFEVFRKLRHQRQHSDEKELVDFDRELSDFLKIQSWFDPDQKTKKISRLSKYIVENSNIGRICTMRRENFSYLLKHFNRLKPVTPLYSTLPQNIVPYMFPLVLKNPDTDFIKLKKKKIPIWRWEELCMSDCKTSRYYSKHLIQLPCHQSLKKYELDAIVQAVKEL
ncbi:MAG: hypothetical protein A2277_14830 [Desulfobacterales bacterium RIFOXYA12_FULL_46_15]|nr:MAG: hypothetical protein A2277_14830 [Desulfobacterales bacterium RIFOXYA12_FULL_46_15]